MAKAVLYFLAVGFLAVLGFGAIWAHAWVSTVDWSHEAYLTAAQATCGVAGCLAGVTAFFCAMSGLAVLEQARWEKRQEGGA